MLKFLIIIPDIREMQKNLGLLKKYHPHYQHPHAASGIMKVGALQMKSRMQLLRNGTSWRNKNVG